MKSRNHKILIKIFALGLVLLFSCCSPVSKRPDQSKREGGYRVGSRTYYPHKKVTSYTEQGIASWYGPKFHGNPTANGEIYNMYSLTAAHRVLPFNTKVKVLNLKNGRSVIVRINDRGPFAKNRIIDLSYSAAQKIGIVGPGTAPVRLTALNKGLEKGKYYVQIGSFTRLKNAKSLLNQLKLKGYNRSRIVKVRLDQTTFWRVQAGIFQGLNSAQSALHKLSRANPNSFIVAD